MRSGRAWAWLAAIGALGVVVGALTLGAAPWASLAIVVVSIGILAALGAVPAVSATGIWGLGAAYVGLLAGLAAATWFRVSASEAGWGGFRSIEPVADWRLAYAACVGAGLFAVVVGYVVFGRFAAGETPRRSALLLGGSLAGSVVAATGLAVILGSSALVIPEGSTTLRMTVTDGMITLEPTNVPAGEVHFVRSQRGRSYGGPFLESGTGPQGVAGAIFHGPLTDDDIAELRDGRLPDGMTVAERYAGVPPGEPASWPTPDEYGGHERLDPGRYAWWTLEVTAADGPRMKDLVFFDAY